MDNPFYLPAQSLVGDYLDGIIDRDFALAALDDLGGSVLPKASVEKARAAVLKYRQRSRLNKVA